MVAELVGYRSGKGKERGNTWCTEEIEHMNKKSQRRVAGEIGGRGRNEYQL